jgi:hypothetical protein
MFVALLLLLSAAVPVLACVTGRAMTHEENACCLAMHGDCGKMAQMGCCKKEIATDDHPQLASSAPSTEIRWVVCVGVASMPVSALMVAPALPRVPAEHSPPGIFISTTTILRI